MKETKQLKKQADRAERFAKVSVDDEYAKDMSSLAAAFRAQAEVLRKQHAEVQKKDKKKEKKKEKEGAK
ncbi:hypothetical protein V1291_004745 [Nitrobacteraceae bacterium AZCC 1564]